MGGNDVCGGGRGAARDGVPECEVGCYTVRSNVAAAAFSTASYLQLIQVLYFTALFVAPSHPG